MPDSAFEYPNKEQVDYGANSPEVKAMTPDRGDSLDHFPPKEILELSQALWMDGRDLKVFKDGQVVLHNLTREKVLNLLGLTHDNEVKNKGFTFKEKLDDNREISSSLAFGRNVYENKEVDPNNEVFGHVIIEMGKDRYDFTVKVDNLVVNEGGNEIVSTVSIIPDVKMSTQDLLKYYQSLANHL